MTNFGCNLSQQTLMGLLPHTVDATTWFQALSNCLPAYQITTRNRVAAFLSQIFVESSKFTILQENLNYSAHNLTIVFPNFFDVKKSKEVEHNPETIANIVYANKMGNGNIRSGDGWNFRGRGLIQISGRYMYNQCSQELFGDNRLIQYPNQLLLPESAVLSSCWFWSKHNLNQLADVSDMTAITKKVTGGSTALDQRLALYKAILASLA